MLRIIKTSNFAAALAAFCLSLCSMPQQRACAEPAYRPGYYYGGGYDPGYGRYSGFGYTSGYTSAYGYADPSPGIPVTPSYRSYGLGNGFGTGGTYRGVYRGLVDQSYGAPRLYTEPERPKYTPYGSGGYGPYGFRTQHDYGY